MDRKRKIYIGVFRKFIIGADKAGVLEPLGIAQEQLAHIRKGYEDQMLPELALTLNGALKGSDDEVVESLKIKYPDFYVVLELRIPSLYQGEKSKIEKKVDVQLEQLEQIIKDLQITLESNLHYIQIQIQDMNNVLELGLKLVDGAQERTMEELKLTNQGRNEPTNVISARDNEMIARLSYVGNAASYQSLVLE